MTRIGTVHSQAGRFSGLSKAILFGAILSYSSIGVVQHAIGTAGAVVYLAIAVGVAGYWFASGSTRVQEAIERLGAARVGAAVIVALTIGTGILYLLASRQIIPGSNERQFITLGAINELLQGKYPYYFSLGPHSPVSQLPGWILLNVPFAYARVYWLQNVFWLAVLLVIASRWFKASAVIELFIGTLLLAPVILQELVSASDLLSNVACVTVIALALDRWQSLTRTHQVLVGILCGFALSSRVHFLLLVPVFCSLVYQRAGAHGVFRFAAVTFTVSAGVTLPFYWFDPARFSPLHTSIYLDPSRWTAFYGVSPGWQATSMFISAFSHTSTIVAGVAGLVAVGTAIRKFPADEGRLPAACALVLAVPPVMGLLLMSATLGRLEAGPYSNHGLAFLFLGALAVWRSRRGRPTPSARSAGVRA